VADPDWGGAANRNLVSYPGGVGDINGIEDFNALVIPRGVVEEALATGTIDAAAVDALLDLRDPDDRARAYGQPLPSSGQRDPRYDASANSARYATLARLMTGGSSDGFRTRATTSTRAASSSLHPSRAARSSPTPTTTPTRRTSVVRQLEAQAPHGRHDPEPGLHRALETASCHYASRSTATS
jgi:hypothetical protein